MIDKEGNERDYRKELWIAIATATASASNCTDRNSPIKWADHALKAFDERFGTVDSPDTKKGG